MINLFLSEHDSQLSSHLAQTLILLDPSDNIKSHLNPKSFKPTIIHKIFHLLYRHHRLDEKITSAKVNIVQIATWG